MQLPSIPAPYQGLVWILIAVVVGLWLLALGMNWLSTKFKSCSRCGKAYLNRLDDCPYCPPVK